MGKIARYLDIASGSELLSHRAELFSRLVYLWFFLVGLSCLPVLSFTIGPESYTFRNAAKPGLRENIVYHLTYEPENYVVVFSLFMLTAVLSFFNVGGIFSRIIFWISALVISMSSYLMFNAGMLLAVNWAAILILFFPKNNHPWKRLFSNLSIIALKLQFITVYFFAALYKWLNADWVSGEAIHFLSMLDHFTPSWVFSALQWAPAIAVVFNYTVLIYLTLFPVIIFSKRLKGPLMLIGVLFHLYTMFIMRLYDFGSIMLIGYLLFIPQRAFLRVEKRLSFLYWPTRK